MVEGCSVDIRHGDDVTCVWVAGTCDLASVAQVRDALDDALARRARRVEIDLAGVTFIDAAGLHELAWSAEHLGRSGGVLVVTNPSPVARRVLAFAGLDGLVGVSTATCSPQAAHR